MPPRVGSLSWYVDPDWVSCSGTVPPYSDWPEPSTLTICCSVRMTEPVFASTKVARRLGVPSFCTPPLSTRQASRGLVPVASTTRAAPSSLTLLMPFVALAEVPLVPAAARVTAGVTPRVRSLLRVRLLPFQVPASVWCTTRSPPTTSRPR